MVKALAGGTTLDKMAKEQEELKKAEKQAEKENGGKDKGKGKDKKSDKNGINSNSPDGSPKSKSGIADFGKKQGMKALDKLVTDDGNNLLQNI